MGRAEAIRVKKESGLASALLFLIAQFIARYGCTLNFFLADMSLGLRTCSVMV
jgi:hypothetical protein